jgi:hypothetical protein
MTQEAGTQGTKCSPTKPYSIVCVNVDDPDMCFGVVGAGGQSFCVRKACECTFMGHVNKKIIFPEEEEGDYLFITREQGVKISTVFTKPRAEVAKVSKSYE